MSNLLEIQKRNVIGTESPYSMATPCGGATDFSIYRLEESCSELAESSHHFEAVDQLKRLHDLRPNNLKTMMLLAGCYIELDRYDEAVDVINNIKTTITEKPRPEIRELILESENSGRSLQRNRELIFLWCACFIYKADRSPRDALDGIGECLDKMDKIGEGMVVREENGKEVSVSYIDDSKYSMIFRRLLAILSDELEDLGRLKSINNDKFTKVKARLQGCIADCYQRQKDHLVAIQRYEECVQLLKDQFGANAPKSFMLGEFLFHICYSHNHTETPDANKVAASALEARQILEQAETSSTTEQKRKYEMCKYLDEFLTPENGLGKAKKKLAQVFGRKKEYSVNI